MAKWLRERDLVLVRKTVEAYAKLFKPVPNVPDKGLENVIHDLQVGVTCRKSLSAATSYFAIAVHWNAPWGNNNVS